jgi:hypothetical protein
MAVLGDESGFRRWWHSTATDDQRSLLARVSRENLAIPTHLLDELSTAGVTDPTASWPATQDDPNVYLSPPLRRLIEASSARQD